MKTQDLQKIFQSHLKNIPTKRQEQFLNKFCEYILDQSIRKLFILKGYAGTGKTTMIDAAVKFLPDVKMKSVLLAPTGRAAKVITNYSKKTAYTIHKKIYVKRNIDGVSQFVLGKNLHTNTIFIVDEASMISSDITINLGVLGKRSLIDDLIEYVYSGKNCHLMFVGDTAQLPPVGEQTSISLNEEELSRSFHFGNVYSIQLTEVVRQQESSGILKNATILRQNIKKEGFPKLSLSDDVSLVTGNELQEFLEDTYHKYGEDGVVIITRANKWANLYNQNIRQRILGQEEELESGDRLMVVKNNYYWLEDDSKMGFIANGDIMRVLRVGKIEELYGFRFANVTVDFPDYPEELELETKVILDSIMIDSPSLSRTKLKELYQAVSEDYSDEKIKRKRLEKVFKDPYFNALQVKFSYAVTCHKSQGGQWPVVFIDQGYLTEEMLGYEHNRWLYTAMTRASEQLYLVNFNPKFFDRDQMN